MPGQRLSDRTVLLLAACAYLPLVFLGYGSDGDSYSVVDTARGLLAGGHYAMSRHPGFPLHEVATAALLPLGGSIATNLASLAGLWWLLRILALAGVPHRDLAALFVASNPYYWVNSASTIDYVWALGLSLGGLYAWMRGRPWVAGALFGLAAGARITSVIVPAAAVLASLLPRPYAPAMLRRGQAPAVIAALAAVALALYALPFAAAGYSLAFIRPPGARALTYYVPSWTWYERGARWIYKNASLCGLPATAVLLAWGVASAVKRPRIDAGMGMVLLSVLAIAGFEVAFWIAPLEPAYLLPILPFAALLVAATDRRRLLGVLVALHVIYATVAVGVLEPDVPHAATTARLRPSVEAGIVAADVRDRLNGRRR
jgi:hypothetical protein